MENLMKNHSTKNTPLDMNKWREIIETWSKSHENQKAYCARLGLSLNTFGYARSKLLQQNKQKTQFLPLVVKSNCEDKTSPSSVVVLENLSGYKLHLPVSLSLEQLTKLFKLSGWCDA
jgi:hypothetical protein